MRFFITGCIVLFIISATPVWPHGTRGSVVKSEAFLVTAEYDDGEPMNYAEINITAPDSDIPFQTGRTDLLGHFLFKPNRQGLWKMEVLDGMGHRLALELPINNDFKTGKGEDISVVNSGNTTPGKTIAGIAIIFGICGILYGWRARRVSDK